MCWLNRTKSFEEVGLTSGVKGGETEQRKREGFKWPYLTQFIVYNEKGVCILE